MFLLLLCASVDTFVYSVCVLAYVWSFLARARGTACVVRYTTLLLQQRLRLLLRVLLLTAAAAAAAAVAAAAAAAACHGFLKVGLPEAASNHYEIK